MVDVLLHDAAISVSIVQIETVLRCFDAVLIHCLRLLLIILIITVYSLFTACLQPVHFRWASCPSCPSCPWLLDLRKRRPVRTGQWPGPRVFPWPIAARCDTRWEPLLPSSQGSCANGPVEAFLVQQQIAHKVNLRMVPIAHTRKSLCNFAP